MPLSFVAHLLQLCLAQGHAAEAVRRLRTIHCVGEKGFWNWRMGCAINNIDFNIDCGECCVHDKQFEALSGLVAIGRLVPTRGSWHGWRNRLAEIVIYAATRVCRIVIHAVAPTVDALVCKARQRRSQTLVPSFGADLSWPVAGGGVASVCRLQASLWSRRQQPQRLAH